MTELLPDPLRLTKNVSLSVNATSQGDPHDPNNVFIEGIIEFTITGVDTDGTESEVLATPGVFKYQNEAIGSVTLRGSIGELSPWRNFRLYRKDLNSAVALYLDDVGTTYNPVDKTYEFVYTGGMGPLTAATPPGNVRMNGGELAAFGANRLWTVDGDTLYYSNPFNPLIRDPFSAEKFNLPDGGRATALVPYNQGVLIFGEYSAVYVTGAPSQGGQIISLALTDGCVGPGAWAYVES